MLCRLIRPGAGDTGANGPGAPEPIVWRDAGGGRPGVPASGPSKASGARAAAPAITGITEAEVQAKVQAAYRQGEAAGTKAATDHLTAPLATIGQMSRELAAAGPRVRAEAELGVVKLAMAIARRVLHRELSTDPEALAGVVRSAGERMNAREINRLRVAPADAATLEKHRERIGLPPALVIAADPALASGSAIFETVRGELDASVETQLDEIERGLTDRLRRKG